METQKITIKHKKNLFLLEGWSNTGTGCQEMLWHIHPWEYLKPDWTWPCATCSSWCCFEEGGWGRQSQEVPSNLNSSVTFWFCELVKNLDVILYVSLKAWYMSYVYYGGHDGPLQLHGLKWHWGEWYKKLWYLKRHSVLLKNNPFCIYTESNTETFPGQKALLKVANSISIRSPIKSTGK